MATNNLIAIPARLVRSLDTGNYTMDGKPTLPVAAAGDSITLFTMVHAGRIMGATLKVPNTVGAAVTLKLQKNSGGTRTDLTVATTAATAGVVTGVTLLPVDFLAGDTVEILTAGGTNAAVIVEYDVVCRHA
jgi:hypothetical protein